MYMFQYLPVFRWEGVSPRVQTCFFVEFSSIELKHGTISSPQPLKYGDVGGSVEVEWSSEPLSKGFRFQLVHRTVFADGTSSTFRSDPSEAFSSVSGAVVAGAAAVFSVAVVDSSGVEVYHSPIEKIICKLHFYSISFVSLYH